MREHILETTVIAIAALSAPTSWAQASDTYRWITAKIPAMQSSVVVTGGQVFDRESLLSIEPLPGGKVRVRTSSFRRNDPGMFLQGRCKVSTQPGRMIEIPVATKALAVELKARLEAEFLRSGAKVDRDRQLMSIDPAQRLPPKATRVSSA